MANLVTIGVSPTVLTRPYVSVPVTMCIGSPPCSRQPAARPRRAPPGARPAARVARQRAWPGAAGRAGGEACARWRRATPRAWRGRPKRSRPRGRSRGRSRRPAGEHLEDGGYRRGIEPRTTFERRHSVARVGLLSQSAASAVKPGCPPGRAADLTVHRAAPVAVGAARRAAGAADNSLNDREFGASIRGVSLKRRACR